MSLYISKETLSNPSLTPAEKLMFSYLAVFPEARNIDISLALGLGRTTVDNGLQKLDRLGLIRRDFASSRGPGNGPGRKRVIHILRKDRN